MLRLHAVTFHLKPPAAAAALAGPPRLMQYQAEYSGASEQKERMDGRTSVLYINWSFSWGNWSQTHRFISRHADHVFGLLPLSLFCFSPLFFFLVPPATCTTCSVQYISLTVIELREKDGDDDGQSGRHNSTRLDSYLWCFSIENCSALQQHQHWALVNNSSLFPSFRPQWLKLNA